MARTATLSVSSPSTTAPSSSNRAGYSPSNVVAAQSSQPSAAGSLSATDSSSMATTATLALTAAPASPNPGPTPTLALTAPKPTPNNRMGARRATSRDAGVGSSTQPPAMGLERTVRVPLNINTNSAVLQQQLLNNRRGIPPKLSHFTRLLDKNTTHMLFRFANKYRPETRKDNRRRRKAKKAAAAASVAVNATDENAIKALDKNKKGKAEALDPLAVYDQQAKNKTPYFLKYGMNHIAALAEKQMAQLVVISDDIEPPEVLVWLPALCRKNDVPCAIVKGSAQLGTLVNKRSATAVAFTKVREEEQVEFLRLVDLITACYAHTNQQPARRAWMGGLRGFKNRVKVALRTAVAANRLQYRQQQQQPAGASAAGATAAGATPIS